MNSCTKHFIIRVEQFFLGHNVFVFSSSLKLTLVHCSYINFSRTSYTYWWSPFSIYGFVHWSSHNYKRPCFDHIEQNETKAWREVSLKLMALLSKSAFLFQRTTLMFFALLFLLELEAFSLTMTLVIIMVYVSLLVEYFTSLTFWNRDTHFTTSVSVLIVFDHLWECIGVISGSLLYIREDFKDVDRKTWLQVMLVATTHNEIWFLITDSQEFQHFPFGLHLCVYLIIW